MRVKSAKPKRNIFSGEGYATYNPKVEGYGDTQSWQQSFKCRMGIDAARATVGSDSPRTILGVSASATWTEIKSTWRKLVMKFHPDNQTTGDPDEFKKVQAAYELLELEFGK